MTDTAHACNLLIIGLKGHRYEWLAADFARGAGPQRPEAVVGGDFDDRVRYGGLDKAQAGVARHPGADACAADATLTRGAWVSRRSDLGRLAVQDVPRGVDLLHAQFANAAIGVVMRVVRVPVHTQAVDDLLQRGLVAV